MLFVVYEICANAISAQNVFMVTKCDIAQCNTVAAAAAATTMAVAIAVKWFDSVMEIHPLDLAV